MAVSNQHRGELAAKRELEVLGVGLLGRGSKFIARLLGVLFALLERSSLVCLCLCPLIMIMRGGHL